MTGQRDGEPDASRPVIRDKRRIDPTTYEVRRPQDAPAAGGHDPEESAVQDNSEFVPDGQAGGDGPEVPLDAQAEPAASTASFATDDPNDRC